MTYVCALPLLLGFVIFFVCIGLSCVGLPVETLIKIFHQKQRLKDANLIIGIEDINGYEGLEFVNLPVMLIFQDVIERLKKAG